MREVVGYVQNPKTGLMKPIYKELGPTPAQWPIGSQGRAVQGQWIVSSNREERNRLLARRIRDKKNTVS